MNPTEGERSSAALATAEVDYAEAIRRFLPADRSRGALLPLLHDLQDELGYVPDAVVPAVAEALNVSRADVHGVITFYHDFRRSPAGRHVVRFCRSESCQARGAARVERMLCEALDVRMGATRADGVVTLEAVHCLGLCAVGPAALVDGRPVARIGAETVRRIALEATA